VINVYNRTGNAFDDGFLNNSDLSASIVADQDRKAQQNGLDAGVGAAAYEALFHALNLNGNGYNYRENALNDPDVPAATGELFGTPRQIRVGARIEL
jgi:hypothetical protein